MFNYKQRILIPLIIAVIILCASMIWLFIAMYQLVYFSEQKDQVDRQRYDLAALGKAITNAESGQRGYLLTGHTLFLSAVEQGRKETTDVIARIDQEAAGFGEVYAELQRLKQLVRQKFDSMDQGIQVQLRAGTYAAHLSLSKDKGHELMRRINVLLYKIDGTLAQLRTAFEHEIRERMIAAVIGALLLCLLIILVLLFSYRHTTQLLEQVLQSQAVTKKLSHQADHDLLTDLPNRRSVYEHLDNIYALARHDSKPFAIFFMDLDGFKQVNDQYGHEMGDALLVEVANMFRRVLRQTDFLARQGG